MLNKVNKNKLRKILLVGFVITIPNSVVINNIFLVLLLLYWLLFGNKQETIKLIKNNIIVQISLAFFIMFIISLLWSSDLVFGMRVILKEKYFLLLPIFMTLIKSDEKELLIKSFIFTMFFSEIILYGVKFEVLPEMFHATKYEPVPFIHHVHYSAFVAFTIYLMGYYYFFRKKRNTYFLFFLFTMTISLFLTGGRVGHVVFFILITLLVIQYFKISIKSIFIILLLPLVFIIGYKSSDIFHDRVNMTIKNIKNYEKNPNTSIGYRFTYWSNSIELIKKYPILGVGCGDFTIEYTKIHEKLTPNVVVSEHITKKVQPHNMYLYIFGMLGIVGGGLFLYLLWKLLYYAFKINDEYKQVRIGLVVYFLVIMLSDSYLYSHFGQALFTIFVSILYKNLNGEKC